MNPQPSSGRQNPLNLQKAGKHHFHSFSQNLHFRVFDQTEHNGVIVLHKVLPHHLSSLLDTPGGDIGDLDVEDPQQTLHQINIALELGGVLVLHVHDLVVHSEVLLNLVIRGDGSEQNLDDVVDFFDEDAVVGGMTDGGLQGHNAWVREAEVPALRVQLLREDWAVDVEVAWLVGVGDVQDFFQGDSSEEAGEFGLGAGEVEGEEVFEGDERYAVFDGGLGSRLES